MANENEAIRQRSNAAETNAKSNDERESAEQLSSQMDDAEWEVTIHQSIDEYNHI